VYITAANYQLENLNDIKSARQSFAKGMKHHKTCKYLYIQKFWLEVQNIEKTNSESYMDGLKTFKKIVRKFNDMNLHFDLFDELMVKAKSFRLVRKLQFNIFRYYDSRHVLLLNKIILIVCKYFNI